MSPQELSRRLRHARLSLGLSQTALGKLVGLNKNTIIHFERSHHDLGLSSVEAIANALNFELVLIRREGK